MKWYYQALFTLCNHCTPIQYQYACYLMSLLNNEHNNVIFKFESVLKFTFLLRHEFWPKFYKMIFEKEFIHPRKMVFQENRFQNLELHHVFAVLAWQKSNDFFSRNYSKSNWAEKIAIIIAFVPIFYNHNFLYHQNEAAKCIVSFKIKHLGKMWPDLNPPLN